MVCDLETSSFIPAIDKIQIMLRSGGIHLLVQWQAESGTMAGEEA